jgi:hypothetical protein
MRTFAVLLAALVLPACATVGLGGSGEGRTELWRQAHDAFARDSVRVAEALFQRLAAEHPRTHEGHEARFYLGMLNLDPRGRLDLPSAVRNLETYLAEDSLQGMRGYHLREAESLFRFAVELQRPCGQRSPALPCDTAATPPVVTRTVPGAPEPPPAGTVSAAEAARLRRTIAEQNAQIQQLQNELQRIRNTLAPRNPRE